MNSNGQMWRRYRTRGIEGDTSKRERSAGSARV
jgi:hypothetical protein